MNRLIVDIETSGYELESLDKSVQDYLTKSANSEEEIQKVRESLSFYPVTGEIVAIGLLNPDNDKGAVYYNTNENPSPFEEDNIVFKGGKEAEILDKFWSVVKGYNQIITFNGRGFDAPFLIIRSAIHRIKPTKNLMPNRYSDEHIDLLDRLTFWGAIRRFNLDTWCKALGIESPKSEEMNGYKVSDMFKSGRIIEIARYCVLDLIATKKLFNIWQEYFNPLR
ncbi:MAG: ribonuclease H-like domain-containing protein [Thermodesulfovibrionales bacterium]|nr:ribonuclease H-like domain-containing protein [Thermodesulfovibrionales bacterium]